VVEGAERFPPIDIDAEADVGIALRDYAIGLIQELTREDSYGMGSVFPREGRDFPELAAAIQQGQDEYVVQPLASYLRTKELEHEGSIDRAHLFVSMALAPVHDIILMGAPRPSAEAIERHAALVTDVFLAGARVDA
jgi:hypothetical protein